MSFSLEYAGTTKTLVEWGVVRANLTQRSLATGELKLVVGTVAANASPVFAYKAKVTLWQGSTKRFVGWVTSLPIYNSAPGEGQQYTISDGWWWLEQTIFQDVSGPFYAESDELGAYPLYRYCSMLTLGLTGQVLDEGGVVIPKPIGDIVRDAVSYAASCGAPISAAVSTLEDYRLLEQVRDLSCADMIRRALNWSPTAGTWWDYSGATPSLRCARSGSFAAISIALDGTIAESWELVPRYDLQVAQVSIYILRTRQRADGTEFTTLKTEGSAGALAPPGSLVASIVMGRDDAGNEETIPSGLASGLYSELSSLQWEGRLVCAQAECTGLARPGNALNLTGTLARTAWNTMRGAVQQVDEDLITGRTTITFGPPSHLSPQDLINIHNAKKNRPPLYPPNPGGGPGGGGGLGGGPPATPYDLELCDGTTINVLLASPPPS